MRSNRLRNVIDDIDDICIGFRDELNNYKEKGELERYHIALMIHDHLIKTYTELNAAIDLFEALEEER